VQQQRVENFKNCDRAYRVSWENFDLKSYDDQAEDHRRVQADDRPFKPDILGFVFFQPRNQAGWLETRGIFEG
jgi:hypothetical protein